MRFRRVSFLSFFAWSVISPSFADFIVLKGDTLSYTTGEQFEGVANQWATHPVLEIGGLQMSASTTDATHTLNANSGEFGIDSSIEDEIPGLFDVGEMMVFYFDKDVELSLLDLNHFDSGDCFVLEVEGSDPLEIVYGDLSNKTSGYYTFSTPQRVVKETEIHLYSSNGSIGMDGIGLQVVPEPMAAGLISVTGIGLLLIRRFSGS